MAGGVLRSRTRFRPEGKGGKGETEIEGEGCKQGVGEVEVLRPRRLCGSFQ